MIKEVKDRGKLCEGRSSGMGFAMLQKSGRVFETVQPLSPCKDFLNEVIFTENTGIQSMAFGLHYKEKLGIFKDNVGYMAIKMLPSTYAEAYTYSPSLEEDRKLLRKNYKLTQKYLNMFEEAAGIEGRTSIVKKNDDYFLVRFPMAWCSSTVGISLLSLLIRVAMVYDGKQELLEFLEKYSYNKADKELVLGAMQNIKKILDTKKMPEQPAFNKEQAEKLMFSPHNLGIVSVKF